ncbi:MULTISPECIES: glycosyltransferase family 39 protein [unclassified Myxococcus]|uniref:glycosyltransferase family 39 protein n=1 Tax=unclassified Myxococcus TaxID=2648731 RepID=UPI00157B6B05|nr:MULTISPECIES: glycosyltransferase family 39 protein [unclassified Myxococcus]NTX33726.1 glycosyltransferase family 39 protein [Myxococcus sp. CA033]NTX58682.1 glycosyltransferase family 39 protein [Myxococcus sp. CA039A]
MTSARGSTGWNAVAQGALGCFLVAAFFGLKETAPGLTVSFRMPFSASSSGELYQWLGHALLLVPGGVLLGLSLVHGLSAPAVRMWRRLEALSAQERRAGAVLVAVVAFLLARVGRFVFLLDRPITDDEQAARFGGQVLASGRFLVKLTDPLESFPTIFLYVRDGMGSSFEWLGLQVAWALGELTGTGSLVFSLAAAVPAVVVAWVATRRLGPAWGGVAALLVLLSPMSALLSMTAHAHLLSRAALSVAVVCFLKAEEKGGRWWTWLGLVSGVSFLCRPFETLFFLAPFYLWVLWRLVRRELPVGACLGGLVLGWLPAVVAFLAFNHAVTGDALLPARVSMYTFPAKLSAHDASMLERFGANTSYNALMLAVWFLGPVGVLLVGVGASWDRLTKLLLLSVLALLGLGLFHDNHGIHSVGPIHYSECAPALALVAVHGLRRLVDVARRAELPSATVMAGVLGSLVVGLGIFDMRNALALREQALIHESMEAYLNDAGLGRAVVLAPQYAVAWNQVPAFRKVGSFVLEWPPPHPGYEEDLIVLHDGPGFAEKLRPRFPDRRFFRMVPGKAPDPFRLEPLDVGGAPPPALPAPTAETGGR